MVSGSQYCIDHVHFDFEIVIGVEVVCHEGIDVGRGIAVRIEGLIAHVNVEAKELIDV